MANSMDTILVKYGTLIKKTDSKKNKKEKIKKIKTVTIPKFLEIDPDKLSEIEQKIQNATQLIYDLNGKKSRLFQKFPTGTYNEYPPLTIDITSSSNDKGFAAVYCSDYNSIFFNHESNFDYLVETIAHELKHAEQCDEEVCKLDTTLGSKDAYAWQQLSLLAEAQAYSFSGRVYYEIFGRADIDTAELYKEISEKYYHTSHRGDNKKIEEKMIAVYLNKLCKRRYKRLYKDSYDKLHPIKEKDKGLSNIPKAFNLSQNVIENLNKVPKGHILSFREKLNQAKENGNRDEYLRLLRILKFKLIAYKHEPDFDIELLNGSWDALGLLNENALENDDLILILSYSDNTVFLNHVLQKVRKKKIFSSLIATALYNRLQSSSSSLDYFVSLIKNKKGLLPVTQKDFADKNDLNTCWINGENFSVLHDLKGKDEQPIISLTDFIKAFRNWQAYAKFKKSNEKHEPPKFVAKNTKGNVSALKKQNEKEHQ